MEIIMSLPVEFGLHTFGDVTRGPDGRLLSHAQVLRNVVDEAVLADELGVDAFGVGEHHRDDFAIAAPEVVLAAIAARTRRIRLGSAVTVLSSDDPIRVFQRFSTVDAISNGRAEVILGRGSFTESFPLFGYPLDQYTRLFEEKLDLYAAVLEHDRTGEPVSWRGSTRAPLDGQHVFPRTEGRSLRTWIGVGGSPESVVRAARYRLPLALAIIGGSPDRFKPYADLYRRALAEIGAPSLPIGVHSPGHIAATDEQARREFWEPWQQMRNRIGAERGWPPTNTAEYTREIEAGSLYVGSPDTVARKIAATIQALGLARFDLKYSAGTLAHDLMLQSIELYGRDVIPRVKTALSVSPPAAAGHAR
jgi:probable LLM family oxidoreductase